MPTQAVCDPPLGDLVPRRETPIPQAPGHVQDTLGTAWPPSSQRATPTGNLDLAAQQDLGPLHPS